MAGGVRVHVNVDEQAVRRGVEAAVAAGAGQTESVARAIAAEARSETPVDSGDTRSRWRVSRRQNGWTVTNPSPVARFLEHGTAPHVIRVKDAKVLTDGTSFFGVEVQHPGTKPLWILRRAVQKVTGR